MNLNSKKEFDDSIELTKKAFMISGFAIGETKYYLIKYLCCFNLIWIYMDVFGEFFWLIDGIRTGKTLDELSLIVPCIMICLLSTAKILPFFLNQRTFQEAVQKLRTNHLDTDESEDKEREIVTESLKFLKSITAFVFLTTLLVVFMFSFEPFMLMGYAYYQSGEVIFMLPFLTKYFFDAYANIAVWSLVYIHQVWSTVAVTMNWFAADSLYYIFCTYIRMHFRILGHRFENFVTQSPEQTREDMRKCIKKHLQLIELVDLVELLYSKSNLFNVTSSSVLICLCGFNIMVVPQISAILAFAPFLVISTAQVFYLCYFGDQLMESSTEISNAVYGCQWYDAKSTIKKNVLIIMIRSQVPCKVTAANFTDINLMAFSAILSRSYSFFALLKTMFD